MATLRVLFVIGLLLIIAAWMVDRITWFPRLLRWIAPEEAAAREAIDQLAATFKTGILPTEKGFDELLDLWPNLVDRNRVRVIGRSVAFQRMSPTEIRMDFDLIPYESLTVKLEPIWSSRDARAIVQRQIDRKVFRLSRIVFAFGMVVTVWTGWPR